MFTVLMLTICASPTSADSDAIAALALAKAKREREVVKQTPVKPAVAKTGYPVRGNWWTGCDNWQHMTKGEHAGKFPSAWLQNLSWAELQSLHSDSHEGKVHWEYVAKTPEQPTPQATRIVLTTQWASNRDGKGNFTLYPKEVPANETNSSYVEVPKVEYDARLFANARPMKTMWGKPENHKLVNLDGVYYWIPENTEFKTSEQPAPPVPAPTLITMPSYGIPTSGCPGGNCPQQFQSAPQRVGIVGRIFGR